MKILRLLVLVFFVLAVSGTFSSFPVLAETKVLKFATPYSQNTIQVQCVTWFGHELEKRTNGRYKADFFFSGTMGKAPDLPALCKDGVVDFIYSASSYTPHLLQFTRGFELMYITDNPYAQAAAFWDMYRNYAPLRNEWDRNGLIPVSFASPDIMACQSKKPINKIEDLKDKKLRSYGASAEMIKVWGGRPISIAFPEVYDALNQGVIDGAFGIPMISVYDIKFWEVAPYIFNTGAGCYAMTYFGISKKVYDNLPPEIKKIINDLSEDGIAYYRKWTQENEMRTIGELKKMKSIQIINWTREEKVRAKNMVVPKIWEDWLLEMKKANLPGEEFLKIYNSLITKYDKQFPYKDPFAY